MIEELRSNYPEIPENQIKVTGTPQFDFYFSKWRFIYLNRWSQLAEKYELDAF